MEIYFYNRINLHNIIYICDDIIKIINILSRLNVKIRHTHTHIINQSINILLNQNIDYVFYIVMYIIKLIE